MAQLKFYVSEGEYQPKEDRGNFPHDLARTMQEVYHGLVTGQAIQTSVNGWLSLSIRLAENPLRDASSGYFSGSRHVPSNTSSVRHLHVGSQSDHQSWGHNHASSEASFQMQDMVVNILQPYQTLLLLEDAQTLEASLPNDSS